MDKKVIAVSGKGGQLGSELQDAAKLFTGYDFVFADKSETGHSFVIIAGTFF